MMFYGLSLIVPDIQCSILYTVELCLTFVLVSGPNGTPRPIELHSHDPLRYVGDMLAWLHQAIASEREHIQALLKKCVMNGRNSSDIHSVNI